MEKAIYDEMPQAIEEVVSAGVRTIVMRFGIEEVDGHYECEEATFNYKEQLTDADYGKLVTSLVREKYSADQMEALHNNYLLNPESYRDDMAVMQAWRQTAKRTAEEVLTTFLRQ